MSVVPLPRPAVPVRRRQGRASVEIGVRQETFVRLPVLAAGPQTVEYKYFCVPQPGARPIWEDGPNRSLRYPSLARPCPPVALPVGAVDVEAIPGLVVYKEFPGRVVYKDDTWGRRGRQLGSR